MNKIKYLVFSLVLFFSLSFNVFANEINTIKLDVFINKDGSASITEIWSANLNQGTEGYHPFYNLGNSSIDFKSVSDDRGVNYTRKEWNVSDDFESKSNHFGIYRDGDELDLCWGISQMGNRVYTLKYDITNFIYNTSDGYQIIYWTFVPQNLSSSVGDVLINIKADEAFSDNLDVWGYGKKGAPCYVKDGIITFTSDGHFSNTEYMTLLVKFDGGTFNTTNYLDKSFDDVLEMAEEGADHYIQDTKSSFMDKLMIAIGTLIEVLFFVFMGLIGYLGFTNKDEYINFKKVKNAPPFRDLPLGEDYLMAHYYVKQYNLNSDKNDVLGAIILKLMKDDCIRFEEAGKKGDEVITLLKEPIANLELDLYKMLVSASVDGKLTSKKFKKYCSDHYTKLFNWVDSVYEDKREELVSSNMITKTEKKKLLGFKHHVYTASDKLNEIGMQMGGLRNFFKDFTSMNEKRPIEVKMWREYLIYAQLMGMAKKVAKDFKKLYPELETDPNYMNTYSAVDRAIYFSNSSVSAAQSAHAAAASSYSGGGGGFSSGGGGGGSFGGGGGGGGGFR